MKAFSKIITQAVQKAVADALDRHEKLGEEVVHMIGGKIVQGRVEVLREMQRKFEENEDHKNSER